MNIDEVMALISGYAEEHPLATEIGSEYIMQDETAQLDALELFCMIFDNMTK